MSEFLGKLNEYYRPPDPVQDRVRMDEDPDFSAAFANFLNPSLLTMWYSEDALQRSSEYQTEHGVKCTACGQPVAYPVTVNGELQPFAFYPTKKDAAEAGSPTIHPQCEARI